MFTASESQVLWNSADSTAAKQSLALAESRTALNRESCNENLYDARIAIVDDDHVTVRCARKYLQHAGFQHVFATSDPRAFRESLGQQPPDLLLLDIMLPGVSGIELMKELRLLPETAHIPIVMMTSHTEAQTRYEALESGANDFLLKPLDALEILPRVRNLLSLRMHQKWLEQTSERLEAEVRKRTAALEKAHHHAIHCLARAAEFRDNDTGRHVVRVGLYSALIARELSLGEEFAVMIEQAAKLHDVGKIGIPDQILLKPGQLDESEYAAMRSHSGLGRHVIEGTVAADVLPAHASIGSQILAIDDSPLLTMASEIAYSHHERWDGNGYPRGLRGEEIPLSARIVAVADVFDALSSRRPYKPAFDPVVCSRILREGRGTQFDPVVLDAFLSGFDRAVEILERLKDG